jgi:hypothetical protein
MGQGRFSALARLGLAKSRARLGRDRSETAAELADLARALDRLGLRHAREMVSRAQEELGTLEESRTQQSDMRAESVR